MKKLSREDFFQTCASENFVNGMLKTDYKNYEDLAQQASKVWRALKESDWLEAFQGHPKIGDVASLQKKFHNTLGKATQEQSGVNQASLEVLKELKIYNEKYEQKFGFIFIVFATGKSAQEMLDLLKSRINNDPKQEIKIASEEQLKITLLRLKNLCP